MSVETTPLSSDPSVAAPILYLDCSSGISGDMFTAALLDLGADEAKLREALASLPLEGYRIEISRVMKSALDVCDFNVVLPEGRDNHDHDMEYLHGHEHAHPHDHEHEHGHEHDHEHEHTHEHEHDHEHEHTHEHEHDHEHEHTHEHEHDYGHEHSHQRHEHHELEHYGHEHHGHDHHHADARNLQDITEILKAGKLSERALSLALDIFRILAEAESQAHGKPVDQIHFHEVGAVDSIIDIAAAAVCIDLLGVQEVILTELTEGTGTVRCQHGILPVPVPAVSRIVSTYRLPLHISPIHGELVTPTGAAIAAALRTGDALPAVFEIERIGMGAGKRDYAAAGFLRAMLIRPAVSRGTVRPAVAGRSSVSGGISGASGVSDPALGACGASSGTADASGETPKTVLHLETNLDDCTGEALGYVMDRLMTAGALDTYFIPIQMKKNRPAVLLNVLCRETDRAKLEDLIFRHTTSTGIRCSRKERTVLPRRTGTVETSLGQASVKYVQYAGQTRCYPEYDSVSALADASGRGFREICKLIQAEAERSLKPDSGSAEQI